MGPDAVKDFEVAEEPFRRCVFMVGANEVPENLSGRMKWMLIVGNRRDDRIFRYLGGWAACKDKCLHVLLSDFEASWIRVECICLIRFSLSL